MLTLTLIWSSFIAGLFTFLAPCTLPLVPGYLAFISGTSTELADPSKFKLARKKVIRNGIFFVLGFTLIFVVLGTATASLSQLLGPDFRLWLSRIGGGIVILFGLMMLNVVKIPKLQQSYKI